MSALINPKILLLLAALVLFFFTGKAYQNQALSFHFVDEEENFTSGKYMLKGERLYSDLFSNHQPMVYIFSAAVQEAVHPNTLFPLIKKHREAVIAWSVIWGIVLVFRFRMIGLLTLAVYEPLKIFLLGNLFLSESFVAYPLAYLLGWIFLSKKIIVWEIAFLGFCLGLSFLLLSPLWLLLGSIVIYMLQRIKQAKWNILGFFGGMLLPVMFTINFISITDYFLSPIYINLHYYIPRISQDPWIITAFKAFVSPILALTNITNNNATLQVARILSIVLLINCAVLIKKRNFKLPLLIFIFLGLANIRFVPPGEQGYSGFHIIPWFISLIMLTFISIKLAWKEYSYSHCGVKLLGGVFLVALVVVVVRESGQTLFQKRDSSLDFYVNYSRQAEFGQAIKVMKTPTDTLFIAPDEWLIYWEADIPHASKMVCYYAWMSDVPEIKDPLHRLFSQNPPTYFYCDKCQLGYFGLEQFFPQYQKINKDGKETSLMVLKSKLESLTKEQKDKLKYYGFEVLLQ